MGWSCEEREGLFSKRFLWPKNVLVAKIARGNTPEATCGVLASEFDLNRRVIFRERYMPELGEAYLKLKGRFPQTL